MKGWWMAAALASAPAMAEQPAFDLGLGLTGGGKAHIQGGVVEGAGSVDLLDLELHPGAWQIVPRVGRFLVGIAALEIVDLEVDVFYRVTPAREGWSLLGAAGLGPRVAIGADQTSGGLRALGRIGATWRQPEGRTRVHLFAEPFAGFDAGPEFTSGDLGLRLGAAFTWSVRR